MAAGSLGGKSAPIWNASNKVRQANFAGYVVPDTRAPAAVVTAFVRAMICCDHFRNALEQNRKGSGRLSTRRIFTEPPLPPPPSLVGE